MATQASTSTGEDGDFQLKNQKVCDSSQFCDGEQRRVIYGRVWRIALRTGKETTHGASLDNTSQNEEWVDRIRNGRGGVLFLVLRSHHWCDYGCGSRHKAQNHFLSMFPFSLTKWLVTRNPLSGRWGAVTSTAYLRGRSSWHLSIKWNKKVNVMWNNFV